MMHWLFILFLSVNQQSVTPETYFGQWRIISGSVIEIYQKNDKYYGKIIKRSMFSFTNRNGLDNKNPDPELRTRKIVGMEIIKDLKFDNGVMKNGTIYNADTGNTYQVRLTISEEDNNELNVLIYKGKENQSFSASRVEQ